MKENQYWRTDGQIQREEKFMGHLDTLFDIAPNIVLSLIKIQEDKKFSMNQRESMSGVLLEIDSYQIRTDYEKQRSFMPLNQLKQWESSDIRAMNIYVDDADIVTSDIISLDDNMDTDQMDDSDNNGI